MGLDVYLYRYDDLADYERREELSEKEQGALWESRFGEGKPEIKTLPQSEQDAFWDEYRAIETKHGVKYEESVGRDRIEFDSKIYPYHMFKVLYYRSSYNGGGINKVARTLGVPGLYDVFDREDDYKFSPDWKECHTRATDALAQWRKKAGDAGGIRIEKVASNPFIKPDIKSEADAMKAYQETMAKPHGFDSFENGQGVFCKEPKPVVAMIHGTEEDFRGGHRPCLYLAVKDENPYDWYLKAMEIVVESIDYVLAQPDPEKHVLHWSS